MDFPQAMGSRSAPVGTPGRDRFFLEFKRISLARRSDFGSESQPSVTSPVADSPTWESNRPGHGENGLVVEIATSVGHAAIRSRQFTSDRVSP